MYIAVYISPIQNIDDTVYFLNRSLLAYTTGVAALLGRGDGKLPMIMSGCFNVNFATDRSELFKQFFSKNFSLVMNNDPETPTTRSGTTIHAVFSRYLHKS